MRKKHDIWLFVKKCTKEIDTERQGNHIKAANKDDRQERL